MLPRLRVPNSMLDARGVDAFAVRGRSTTKVTGAPAIPATGVSP
jgi:hypothetical protein